MNKTILMGRLTRDPEVRYAANDSGMAIVRYTLAVDRRRTGNDGQSADFINCVAFGKTGEFAEKYFRKGTKILISGRIQTGSYTNQENQRIYTTEVIVEDQEFAESKRASEEAAASAPAPSAPQPAAAPTDAMPMPEPLPFAEDERSPLYFYFYLLHQGCNYCDRCPENQYYPWCFLCWICNL